MNTGREVLDNLRRDPCSNVPPPSLSNANEGAAHGPKDANAMRSHCSASIHSDRQYAVRGDLR